MEESARDGEEGQGMRIDEQKKRERWGTEREGERHEK